MHTLERRRCNQLCCAHDAVLMHARQASPSRYASAERSKNERARAHQEVEEAPELGEVVLEGRAREQQLVADAVASHDPAQPALRVLHPVACSADRYIRIGLHACSALCMIRRSAIATQRPADCAHAVAKARGLPWVWHHQAMPLASNDSNKLCHTGIQEARAFVDNKVLSCSVCHV